MINFERTGAKQGLYRASGQRVLQIYLKSGKMLEKKSLIELFYTKRHYGKYKRYYPQKKKRAHV